MNKTKPINQYLSDYPFLVPIFFSILVIVLYSNSIKSPFMRDDNFTVVENPYITSFVHLKDLFSPDYYSHFGELTYRPMVTLSYFLDYHFYQLSPAGYHITNLFFHLLSALFVYYLFTQITSSFALPFVTALLFAIHPIQAEAVNSISFRDDLMATAFTLLSMLMFLRMAQKKGGEEKIAYSLSLLFFILGSFAKETALMIPVYLLLCEVAFLGKGKAEIQKNLKKRKWRYAGFFLFLLFDFFVLPFLLPKPSSLPQAHYPGESFAYTILTMSKVFVFYLRNLLFPIYLSADYAVPLSRSLFDPLVFLGIILFLLLIFLTLFSYKRYPSIFFNFGFFLIALLPVSNLIVPIGHKMNDRFLYMPSIGFLAALSALLFHFFRPQRLWISITCVVCIGLFTLTLKQNALWQNEFVLWTHVLERHPNSYQAWLARGIIFNRYRRPDLALVNCKKALTLYPDNAAGLSCLGLAYAKQGHYDQALKYFSQAIQNDPYDAKMYSNRGLVYAKSGKPKKALKDWGKALQLNPYFTEVYLNRGILYLSQKQDQQARRDLQRAQQLGSKVAGRVLSLSLKQNEY